MSGEKIKTLHHLPAGGAGGAGRTALRPPGFAERVVPPWQRRSISNLLFCPECFLTSLTVCGNLLLPGPVIFPGTMTVAQLLPCGAGMTQWRFPKRPGGAESPCPS